MSRVFVAEPTRYDLTEVRRYGEIVYIQPEKRIDPLNPEASVSFIATRIQELGYNPETDFICMTGQQLTVALMLSVFTSEFSPVRVLMFDARTAKYCERKLDVEFCWS